MDYEQLRFKLDGNPIFWRQSPGGLTIELTAACRYISEKLFVDILQVSWPTDINPTPFFQIKVPSHCNAPYIKEVIIPGILKLVDGFDVTFKKRYIRFDKQTSEKLMSCEVHKNLGLVGKKLQRRVSK